MLYFPGIDDFRGECLPVKNQREWLTGDDGVGIMKIITMIDGKDVLKEYLI